MVHETIMNRTSSFYGAQQLSAQLKCLNKGAGNILWCDDASPNISTLALQNLVEHGVETLVCLLHSTKLFRSYTILARVSLISPQQYGINIER